MSHPKNGRIDSFTLTQHGFNWGPVIVERYCSDKRGVLLGIRSARQELQVFITPSGLIRVGKPQKARKR